MSRPATELIRRGVARAGIRHELDADGWLALRDALAEEPELDFLGLWAEEGAVHAAFHGPDGVLLATLPVTGGTFPALSPGRPAAAWFERAVADLWGRRAEGGTDGRPWLAVLAGSGDGPEAEIDRRDATAQIGLANVLRDLPHPADPSSILYLFRLP